MPFNISERIIFSLPGGFFRFSPFIRRLFPGSVSGGHRGQEPFPNGNAPARRRLANTAAGSPAVAAKHSAILSSGISFPARKKNCGRSDRSFLVFPICAKKHWSRSLRGSLFPQSEVSPLRDKRGERTHRSSDRGHFPKEQFFLFRGHTRDPRRQAPCLRSAQRAEPWCLSR